MLYRSFPFSIICALNHKHFKSIYSFPLRLSRITRLVQKPFITAYHSFSSNAVARPCSRCFFLIISPCATNLQPWHWLTDPRNHFPRKLRWRHDADRWVTRVLCESQAAHRIAGKRVPWHRPRSSVGKDRGADFPQRCRPESGGARRFNGRAGGSRILVWVKLWVRRASLIWCWRRRIHSPTPPPSRLAAASLPPPTLLRRILRGKERHVTQTEKEQREGRGDKKGKGVWEMGK